MNLKKMNCKVIIGNKYNDLYNFIIKIISNEKNYNYLLWSW